MSQKKAFHRVVGNALDFLERALEEFESFPKYSVIHFHAAVELFLKARLMAEHWSLVISKKHDPDLKKFMDGDFVSVTFDEAALKLDKVLQSPLSAKEIDAFKSLAKHRNRMVHFYHQADSAEIATEELRIIAREQLAAWYLLHRILLERWKDVFQEWEPKFAEFSKKLRKHHEFLQVVFDDLQVEIQKRKANGAVFQACPSCGFLSQEVEDRVGVLKEGTCLVCEFRCPFVTITCPDCQETVTFLQEGFGECEKCGRKFEPEDLHDLLAPARHPKECDFESPIHCANCEGYDTVIEQGEGYFCTSCFEEYDRSDLEQCSWCGEYNAGGDMEDSEWSGCTACEGRGGWDKDD